MRVGSFAKLFLALVVLGVTITALSPVEVRGQASGATLSGTVADESGSLIPNVTVSIRNTSTAAVREAVTDTAGFYVVPNLPPGVYDVTSSATGFSTQVKNGVTLTVGAQQTLNFSLTVGQVNQKIEVTAEAVQVELTSSAISGTVAGRSIEDLPLNGRDWSALAALEPGVTGLGRTQILTTGDSTRGNRGFGNELSIVGHRPAENNYRVNGISINDYSNAGPGNVLGFQLGVDAIQEFSVLTSNYTAEYGRTSGGVINAVMKSGTNSFHGDAYGFLRDEDVDARNAFDPAQIPPFHRNQMGVAGGAPIRKDKTFLFADYEFMGQVKSLSGNSTVPSPSARGIGPNGQPTVAMLCLPNPANPSGPCVTQPLPAAGAGTTLNPAAPNPDPVTHIDAAVLPFLALYPLPNGGLIGNGDTGHFLAPITQAFNDNYETARFDQVLSSKDNLDVVFFDDQSYYSQPDAFLLSTTATTSGRVMVGVEETHVFSATMVNTARVGYNRTHGFINQAGVALSPLASDTRFTAGLATNRFAPFISATGLTSEAGALNAIGPNNHLQNSYQFNDDAFLTRGAHSLKFGFVFERIQYDELSLGKINGSFAFKGTLDSFLTNEPASFGPQNNVLTPTFPVNSRASIFGGYIQDNWRFRPNLTLNFGLRYEMSTDPTEANNNWQVLTCITCSTVTPVSHLYASNPTVHNFEPRVGFAWDPFHDSKTSVRSGFGIFDVLPLPYVSQVTAAASLPFQSAVSVAALPIGAFPKLAGVNPASFVSSLTAYEPEQNPKRNYAMNWNLTIQRQVSQAVTATVGYVGSRTVHSAFTVQNADMVSAPEVITVPAGGGLLWPCGPNGKGSACAVGFLPTGTQAAPIKSSIINPNFGTIKPTFFGNSSSYNGLQAQVATKVTHGMLAQASFTWGKCLDNGSDGALGNGFANSISSPIYFAPNARKGQCDFNVSKNLVVNWVWDIPSRKFSSPVLSHIVGGWEVGGILSASTGVPFTVLMGGDGAGLANGDPDVYPNRIAGCNPINPNYRTTLQYVNVSCFTPPTAPASMAAQCAVGSFPAAGAAPSGQVYCQNLLGNTGRNALTGPGILSLDASVIKNNFFPRISEKFNVQFRAEAFNIINHANYAPPIDFDALFGATGALVNGAGTLDTTSTDARQIQFGLKVIW